MENYEDFLKIYYAKLFPHSLFVRWLTYNPKNPDYFRKREFSFTLKDDVYIRYLSFDDAEGLKKELLKRNPHKIDIGAVYSHEPKQHSSVYGPSFQALERELVFDIDMTDYDDVRSCCGGTDICSKCWPLMKFAVKILDSALRRELWSFQYYFCKRLLLTEDFGFEHIIFVYSGRRGIHCWICDESARRLSQSARSAIAEYLSIVKGGENQSRKVLLNQHLHPSIRRALDIMDMSGIEDYANTQINLDSEEKETKLLNSIQDPSIRKQVKSALDAVDSKIWRNVKIAIESCLKSINIKDRKGGQGNQVKDLQHPQNITKEILIQYAYPRLDVNVTKGVNHLLKSPFCIHPKTGRVCVPFSVNDVDDFDPMTVPTVEQAINELDQCDQKPMETENEDESQANSTKKRNIVPPSLKPCMDLFDSFVKRLESEFRRGIVEKNEATLDF